MLLPDLAGHAGGEADALIDELLVPRIADAKRVHVADLHVRHHLRRRNDDGRNILVRIDAASGEPVAQPKIVRAAGEGHGDLHFLAFRPLFLEGGLERRGVQAGAEILVFVGDRDALGLVAEPRDDIHGRRHVVLRDLAGRDQIGHRRQYVRAVDAVARAAEHEIVARRRPGGLLDDLDILQSVFVEDALFLGDDEWRRVRQRDVAELDARDLGSRALREHAARNRHAGGAEQGRRAGLERDAPGDSGVGAVLDGHAVHLWRMFRPRRRNIAPTMGPWRGSGHVPTMLNQGPCQVGKPSNRRERGLNRRITRIART